VAHDSAAARFRRWLAYRGVSAATHQPRLLRAVAALARQQPWLARAIGAVVTRDDVVTVFDRQALFSSTAHRPNLIAGDFLIGRESGPAHAAQRQALSARLPAPAEFAMAADDESRTLTRALLARPARRFDLVADYMAPIVWRALRGCFGDALPMLAGDDPLFGHLRRVGAHLIVGSIAPEPVRADARESAAALDAWVRERLPAIQAAWGAAGAESREPVVRDAVGLLWVGHPATVQAVGLIVLELLPRKQWRSLSAQARRVEGDAWEDAALRTAVTDHVLEALRWRPPFPVLRRDVVRDGHVGAGRASRAAGGTTLTLFAIGAMFDPAAHANSPSAQKYCPARHWVDETDRHLMFGHGARQCIARDHVEQVLVSALIGLLLLPGLKFADPWWRRFHLDGPAIARLRMAFKAA
jgi:hypothetical protein